MIRTSLVILLIIFSLLQGCQRQISEDYENTMEISKMNEDDNLLTKEEARQALLEMFTKHETISEALSKIRDEEIETLRKIGEEYRRKEKELLEITEHHEDVEQVLKELREERDEQKQKTISHYTTLIYDDKWEAYNDQEFDDMDYTDVNLDKIFEDYDKLFEDYVTITITEVKNFERSGDWECSLKTGWFRKSVVSTYIFITENGRSFNAVHGRIRKNKNGEWVATIEAYPVRGDRMSP